jgi:transcriptional regulatory protein RtcR
MATLASGGRITGREVDDEIARLTQAWRAGATESTPLIDEILNPATAAALDRFDRVQLEEVLRACAKSASLSEAGRALFSESRKRRNSTNDADRLRKYLARFNLDWQTVRGLRVM